MRGNITKRGKNSWQLKFDPPTIEGKRKQRYATVRGTFKDAQKKLTELLSSSDSGPPGPVERNGERISAWLAQ